MSDLELDRARQQAHVDELLLRHRRRPASLARPDNSPTYPFWKRREVKSDEEVAHIRESLNAAERGIDAVRRSTIGTERHRRTGTLLHRLGRRNA
jgi:hypothetical protein